MLIKAKFNRIRFKIEERERLELEADRITAEYNNSITEITSQIADLDIDHKYEVAYNIGVYAKENYKKCENMTIYEAYKYVDMLMEKYEDE